MRVKNVVNIGVLLALVSVAYAVQDVVTAVHGTVDDVDTGSKTIIVKSADGVKHSIHFVDRTIVHGADLSKDAGKDSWHGVEKGSEVVAHYTSKGGEDTAVEVDKVGYGGLKTTEGTVKEIDRGGKKLVVDTGKGSEETFRLTDHASVDAGKGVEKGTVKGSKVTVYYSEEAGKKVAHFFKAI
jgi:hypothetical protein